MSRTIENGITRLENLFAVNSFRIPQYQRAYSWEREPHLEAFLEDLRQQVKAQARSADKHYFLGTFLLHEQSIGLDQTIVNIVDGQQRMTTSVVFIATALWLAEQSGANELLADENLALLRRTFVQDSDAGVQKFRTIAEDEPFFQSRILGIGAGALQTYSPSSVRLQNAREFFRQTVGPNEWAPLIRALRTARVMVYSVASEEDATQIFELQNDRGKPLTNLEALKSFLMHSIYLHADGSADDRLRALQQQFAKIYRTVESLSDWWRAPAEDQVLAYHCVAFLKWSEKEYGNPKHLVKATIKQLPNPDVIPWIESFVASLVETFRSIQAIFKGLDRLRLDEFSELLMLGRMGSFWPLVLKTWRFDDSDEHRRFLKACRLLELYSFRGYAMANLRGDASQYTFYTAARDFQGDFEGLYDLLADMSYWHNLSYRFVEGLQGAGFYEQEGNDGLYLLWRYENHLRAQPGRQFARLSWREYAEPASVAVKLSIDHIAAQKSPIAKRRVEWHEGERRPFAEVALHRLGNLVINSISANAARGNKELDVKNKNLSDSPFVSQAELRRFVADNERPEWDVQAVKSRQKELVDFATRMWDPASWHTKKGPKP